MAPHLPSVDVDSFNIELQDEEGFLGDRASKGAFRDVLEKWRKPLRKSGEDPFGKEHSENISKKALDAILLGDDTEASAVVHCAVEDFAQELAKVTRRFNTKAWDKTERIVVGGGFRDSRARRSGTVSIAITRSAPSNNALLIANWPTGPQPHTATVSPPLRLEKSAAM
jgi:hypothetical protein